MYRESQTVLFDEQCIKACVHDLGNKITEDYAGKTPVMITILKGGFVFFADLIRAIKIPVKIDFIRAKSYLVGTESSGDVTLTDDLSIGVENQHVIIVEDIIDTGRTLLKLKNYLLGKGAASVKIIAMLDKPARRVLPIDSDYTGFTIEDKFVVGYGLDCDEEYRNLPYITTLEEIDEQVERSEN